MSAAVQTNANPAQDIRTLEANGPFGFITSVFNTLRRFDRPYYFGAAVPSWLESGIVNSGNSAIEKYQQEYQQLYQGGMEESIFQTIPHCIVYQYRVYPANKRNAGVNDSPSGSTRQKNPSEAYSHSFLYPEAAAPIEQTQHAPHIRPAIGPAAGRPLWPSREHVPDIIKPHVTDNTLMWVSPWEYDVFVDFVLLSGHHPMLELMRKDLMLILRTFHDRSHTGASNLTGWFFKDVSGAPPAVESGISKQVAARTITWRLKQMEGYAFPADIVNNIHIELEEARVEF